MARYWCAQALPLVGGDAVESGLLLTVDGDTITATETGVATAPHGAVRLDGLTMPGFANAHSHAFHRALRGRTHGAAGTFWTWREQMYELADRLDPDTYEELATATFAEMVLAGYTVVGEFHYLHHDAGGKPYDDPNEMGQRILRGATRAGIRITLLDTCYLHGGIDTPLRPVQTRFADATAADWSSRVDQLAAVTGPQARIGAAIHSVRAVDPHSIEVVARWADARDCVLHAHVSEQPQENADCLAAYGRTPVSLLDDCGALDERFTAVHATHLTDLDITALRAAGARCCICPTTERDLADGIGPTGALRRAGIGLCIGSDSHAVIDPFEEARAVELDERLATRQRGTHPAARLLRDATAEGAASLGWRSGMLASGCLADFVTVDLNGTRLAGSGSDLAGAAVFAAGAADVRHVVIGGRVVVRDGMHESIDVADALRRSIRAAWGSS